MAQGLNMVLKFPFQYIFLIPCLRLISELKQSGEKQIETAFEKNSD